MVEIDQSMLEGDSIDFSTIYCLYIHGLSGFQERKKYITKDNEDQTDNSSKGLPFDRSIDQLDMDRKSGHFAEEFHKNLNKYLGQLQSTGSEKEIVYDDLAIDWSEEVLEFQRDMKVFYPPTKDVVNLKIEIPKKMINAFVEPVYLTGWLLLLLAILNIVLSLLFYQFDLTTNIIDEITFFIFDSFTIILFVLILLGLVVFFRGLLYLLTDLITEGFDPFILDLIWYTNYPESKEKVFSKIDDAIKTIPQNSLVIFIGHSLGSVIAFDYLKKYEYITYERRYIKTEKEESTTRNNGHHFNLLAFFSLGSPIRIFSQVTDYRELFVPPDLAKLKKHHPGIPIEKLEQIKWINRSDISIFNITRISTKIRLSQDGEIPGFWYNLYASFDMVSRKIEPHGLLDRGNKFIKEIRVKLSGFPFFSHIKYWSTISYPKKNYRQELFSHELQKSKYRYLVPTIAHRILNSLYYVKYHLVNNEAFHKHVHEYLYGKPKLVLICHCSSVNLLSNKICSNTIWGSENGDHLIFPTHYFRKIEFHSKLASIFRDSLLVLLIFLITFFLDSPDRSIDRLVYFVFILIILSIYRLNRPYKLIISGVNSSFKMEVGRILYDKTIFEEGLDNILFYLITNKNKQIIYPEIIDRQSKLLIFSKFREKPYVFEFNKFSYLGFYLLRNKIITFFYNPNKRKEESPDYALGKRVVAEKDASWDNFADRKF